MVVSTFMPRIILFMENHYLGSTINASEIYKKGRTLTEELINTVLICMSVKDRELDPQIKF